MCPICFLQFSYFSNIFQNCSTNKTKVVQHFSKHFPKCSKSFQTISKHIQFIFKQFQRFFNVFFKQHWFSTIFQTFSKWCMEFVAKTYKTHSIALHKTLSLVCSLVVPVCFLGFSYIFHICSYTFEIFSYMLVTFLFFLFFQQQNKLQNFPMVSKHFQNKYENKSKNTSKTHCFPNIFNFFQNCPKMVFCITQNTFPCLLLGFSFVFPWLFLYFSYNFLYISYIPIIFL